MKNKNIYWKDVIEMLKKGVDKKDFDIDFNNEKVEFKEASLLNRNGIRVPENLIYYDEDNIDFSDNPDITNEEIALMNSSFNIAEILPVKPEIKEWIKKEKIDVNKILGMLVENLCKTMKVFPKNATS